MVYWFAIMSGKGHQLWTVQATTEYISIFELVNHGTWVISPVNFWLRLSLTPKTMYTHGPQGINYLEYLHVLKYLLLLY